MKKKVFLVLLAIFTFISIPIARLKADSGWDSDYDSGWSDSGSSWDSDYDYDSGGSYSSSSGSLSGFDILLIIAIIIIIIVFASKKKNQPGVAVPIDKASSIRILTDEEVHNIDPSINVGEVKNYAFDLYKNVQNAWMNFDYDKLREYLSDELYNNYKMQLDTLKIKNGKNIMEDITFISSGITDVVKTENLETITLMMTISMKDYVVDGNNNVIRGNKFATSTITYLITLERSLQKELTTCPNCGAELKGNASSTCPYCDSVIVKNTSKFIMTKKENIKQNWR